MVGRKTELEIMRSGLVAASTTGCTCRLVAGGHGVGKTRLLDATISEARGLGFGIVRTTAYQGDANVPYSVVADALTPLVRSLDPGAVRTLTRGADAELGFILPALGAPAAQTMRLMELGDATPRLRWHTAQFLARLSAKTPLLLVIDNAHWADPSSVALLHFILRHAPESRLMIAAAFNPLETEATSPIRSMAKAVTLSSGVEQLALQPLELADIVALLVQRFNVEASEIGTFAAFLHGRTLGNPFFVEETLKTLITRGRLRSDANRWVGWDTEDSDVPATIREVLLERVNTLSPRARVVADLAAVIGAHASHDLLRETSGLGDGDFMTAIEEVRRSSILTEVEEGANILYDCTHPLLQRTLYEEVGAARRRELHAAIALWLERHFAHEAEQHATDLAYHFVRAGTPALASRSLTYLRKAGCQALAMRADREATRYLQHGLDLLDREESRSEIATALLPDFLEGLARARQRLGEYDASLGLWLRMRDFAAAADDESTLARVEYRLGLLAFWSGHAQSALDHYDRAVVHARRAGRLDAETRILVTRGLALMALGRPDDAKHEVHAALDLVEQSGDLGLRARVERALLMLYAYTGPADVGNALAQRVLKNAEATGELLLAWAAHHATAVLACFTANAKSVAHHVAEADRIAKAMNSPLLMAQIAEVAIEYASAKGDWAEGLALAERMIPIARAMSPRSLLPRLLVWTGTILLNRDEIERAKACFDEAWEASRAGEGGANSRDLNSVIVAYIGQAAHSMTMRDWPTAVEFAHRGSAIADQHGMRSWSLHRLLPMLAESALWTGDFELAERSAARLRDDSLRFEHRLGQAGATTIELLISRWRDNLPGITERLLAAADQLEQVPFVFHAGRLRRHVARLLTFDGDREGAARELRRAHDVFLRLGAALELRLTREAMRELGLRPPQQTMVQGGNLTHREREIIALVSRHKTNKEIAQALDISSRTVSTHLSNVFLKLGVESRGALTELMRTEHEPENTRERR
jgi:DNA-binding CsgD family transcriptional regulator/tetratricopeptide (TPR) repeat protein